jgi:hypothetical protein
MPHKLYILFLPVEYGTNMGYNDPVCTSIPCGRNTSTTKMSSLADFLI